MLGNAQVLKAITANNADADARWLLNPLQACFGVPIAGEFSAPLIDEIADWQRSAGLLADGVLGPKTRDRLAELDYLGGVPCANLWPDEGADPAAHFRDLLGMWGVELPADGAPLLVGLRGCFPRARKTHRSIHLPLYDDTYVLLVGSKATVFAGATHAYQLNSSESPKDGSDGLGDVGSIRPGRYVLKDLKSEPPIFSVWLPSGSGDLPCFRDFDHDGVITEAEAAASVALRGKPQTGSDGCFAQEVLVHPGYTVMKPGAGRPFSSIACCTMPDTRPLRMAGPEIHFELLNATDLASGVAKTIPAPPGVA